MFVYFCSIKIHTLGFGKLLESIFRLLLVVEAFSLQRIVEMVDEVVVCWWEVKWIWWVRQNFLVQFIPLLTLWLCGMQLGMVVENWALSVDQYWLQALQFLVHLIDLLSILLRYNDCTRIQKAVVDQTGSRPPNSDQDLFLVQVWLRKVLGAFSRPIHWAGHHWLSYKIRFLSQKWFVVP